MKDLVEMIEKMRKELQRHLEDGNMTEVKRCDNALTFLYQTLTDKVKQDIVKHN